LKTNVQEMASRMGYITEEEFIDLAGITACTAEAWRKRGQGPDYALLGNKYYYSYESVADTLAGKQRRAEKRGPGRPPKPRGENVAPPSKPCDYSLNGLSQEISAVVANYADAMGVDVLQCDLHREHCVDTGHHFAYFTITLSEKTSL
jgi:hypothetical protein